MIFIRILNIKLYIASEAAARTPVITCRFVPDGMNLDIRGKAILSAESLPRLCNKIFMTQMTDRLALQLSYRNQLSHRCGCCLWCNSVLGNREISVWFVPVRIMHQGQVNLLTVPSALVCDMT
jgi:hypothetical protein